MIGYKGFKSDLTCQGFQYRIDQVSQMDPTKIVLGQSGFHLCRYPIDVLRFYSGDNDVYAQVKADGVILEQGMTCVTNQITIIQLLSKSQLLQLMPDMIVRPNGDQEWYHNGLLHREDGPAVVTEEGDQLWYRHGLLHRDQKPAIIRISGHKEWYQHGVLHREGGPAFRGLNGYRKWYYQGRLHREDGPAIELTNGEQRWYQHGTLLIGV